MADRVGRDGRRLGWWGWWVAVEAGRYVGREVGRYEVGRRSVCGRVGREGGR